MPHHHTQPHTQPHGRHLRRRGSIRAAAVAAVVTTTLILTGCSGSEPIEPPPLAATPSATPSASPTTPAGPPPLPPEAEGTTDAAAIAFVQHWVDLVNYAADTLDTTELKRFSSKNCSGCKVVVEKLDELQRTGGSIEGVHWTVIEPVVLQEAGPISRVRAVVKTAPSALIASAGSPPENSKAGKGIATFHLRPDRDNWRVVELVVELS